MSVLASLLELELVPLVAPEEVVPEPALPVMLAPLVAVPEPALPVVLEPDIMPVMPEPGAPLPPAAPLALPEEPIGLLVVVREPQATKAATASEMKGVKASRRECMMGSPVGADRQQTRVTRARHCAASGVKEETEAPQAITAAAANSAEKTIPYFNCTRDPISRARNRWRRALRRSHPYLCLAIGVGRNHIAKYVVARFCPFVSSAFFWNPCAALATTFLPPNEPFPPLKVTAIM